MTGRVTDAGGPEGDEALLERLAATRAALETQIARRIVGQAEIVEKLLVTLLAGGHALVVGVPGLAKTTLIATLADTLRLRFHRIQFTPDLMPSDITGTDVLDEDPATGRRVFRFVRGPIFANVLLADEINRTPPKTQAALLQAMQEGEVTAGNETYRLERPFFVLATQNPIEHEGTYPLPEAQLDRFMLELRIGYPEFDEEIAVAERGTAGATEAVDSVLDADGLAEFQGLVRRVPVAPSILRAAVRLVRATRPDDREAPPFVREMVAWGAGPRASQYLVLGARARAALDGRASPDLEDLRALAPDVLRHRVVPGFEAEAADRTADDIIAELVAAILA
ncbi:MAG: AAA family ATPase [Gemmatimonadota bacterium]|nr:AAA family ATPase [Gemmatimonadota bacterium]